MHVLALVALAALACAAPSAKGRFTYFDMVTPNAGPCDLSSGPDGAVWVQNILADTIDRIDPATGAVTEYKIPYTAPALNGSLIPTVGGRSALACAIRNGADGMLYASSGIRNQFVQINPHTKKLTVFPPHVDPAGNLQPFNDIWKNATGMFFTRTTQDVITHFDYNTHKMTNYKIPTPGAGPLGLRVAQDGIVWFCEFLLSRIGRLDPQTGEVSEFPLPLGLTQPAVMRVETEGKYLWFTAFTGNAIGRLDTTTGKSTAFKNNVPASLPSEITKDSMGRIWFSTWTDNTLNYYDPATGELAHINQPASMEGPRVPPYVDIAVHYGPDNAIYFTNTVTNQVGRYQLE